MATKLIMYKPDPKAGITSIVVDECQLPWQAVVTKLENHQPGASKSAQLVDIKMAANGSSGKQKIQ